MGKISTTLLEMKVLRRLLTFAGVAIWRNFPLNRDNAEI